MGFLDKQLKFGHTLADNKRRGYAQWEKNERFIFCV